MKKILVCLFASYLCCACSAFRSPKETISVMTNQPDSIIYINGKKVGHGNVQTKVKRSKNVQVMASKPGYQSAYYNIDSNINVTGILDIIGTFIWIVPIIGIFTPGSKSLDENNVALNLDPITLSTPQQTPQSTQL